MNQPAAETTWPRILPFYRVVALVIAVALTLGLIRLAIWHASPLQQFCLPQLNPQRLRGEFSPDGMRTYRPKPLVVIADLFSLNST